MGGLPPISWNLTRRTKWTSPRRAHGLWGAICKIRSPWFSGLLLWDLNCNSSLSPRPASHPYHILDLLSQHNHMSQCLKISLYICTTFQYNGGIVATVWAGVGYWRGPLSLTAIYLGTRLLRLYQKILKKRKGIFRGHLGDGFQGGNLEGVRKTFAVASWVGGGGGCTMR